MLRRSVSSMRPVTTMPTQTGLLCPTPKRPEVHPSLAICGSTACILLGQVSRESQHEPKRTNRSAASYELFLGFDSSSAQRSGPFDRDLFGMGLRCAFKTNRKQGIVMKAGLQIRSALPFLRFNAHVKPASLYLTCNHFRAEMSGLGSGGCDMEGQISNAIRLPSSLYTGKEPSA